MEQDKHSLGVARNRMVVVLLAIIAMVALGLVLKVTSRVLIPLVLAWLLSNMLGPVVLFFVRRKIPAGIAIFLVIILLLGICYVGGVFMYGRIMAFVREYPKYEAKLAVLSAHLAANLDLPKEVWNNLEWTRKLGSLLLKVSGSFVSFISETTLVLIFLVFMLMARPYSDYKIRKAFATDLAERLIHIADTITNQIGRYLGVMFLISFATGLLVWMACALLKVDFAVTWGALAFALNFVPTIGSIIASIPPIVLALVQYYPDYWPAVFTFLAILAIQQTLGNFITPLAMGDKLNLSPVVILISLLFWGWLWGPIGALLSVLLAAALKIVCENVAPLRPFSIMMGTGKGFRKEFEKKR